MPRKTISSRKNSKEAASTMQQSAPSGYIYADEEITVTTIPGPLINKILSPNKIFYMALACCTWVLLLCFCSAYCWSCFCYLACWSINNHFFRTFYNNNKHFNSFFSISLWPRTSHFTNKELGRLYQHCASTNNKNTSTGARKTNNACRNHKTEGPSFNYSSKGLSNWIKKPQEKKTTFWWRQYSTSLFNTRNFHHNCRSTFGTYHHLFFYQDFFHNIISNQKHLWSARNSQQSHQSLGSTINTLHTTTSLKTFSLLPWSLLQLTIFMKLQKKCFSLISFQDQNFFFLFLTKCQSGQSSISLKHHFLKALQWVRWFKQKSKNKS